MSHSTLIGRRPQYIFLSGVWSKERLLRMIEEKDEVEIEQELLHQLLPKMPFYEVENWPKKLFISSKADWEAADKELYSSGLNLALTLLAETQFNKMADWLPKDYCLLVSNNVKNCEAYLMIQWKNGRLFFSEEGGRLADLPNALFAYYGDRD